MTTFDASRHPTTAELLSSVTAAFSCGELTVAVAINGETVCLIIQPDLATIPANDHATFQAYSDDNQTVFDPASIYSTMFPSAAKADVEALVAADHATTRDAIILAKKVKDLDEKLFQEVVEGKTSLSEAVEFLGIDRENLGVTPVPIGDLNLSGTKSEDALAPDGTVIGTRYTNSVSAADFEQPPAALPVSDERPVDPAPEQPSPGQENS
jgi:hypothetical protein